VNHQSQNYPYIRSFDLPRHALRVLKGVLAVSYHIISSTQLLLQLDFYSQFLTLANAVGQLGDWLRNVMCASPVQQETWFQDAFGPSFNSTYLTVNMSIDLIYASGVGYSRKLVPTL
jgi:hypothetical protein